MGDSCPNRHRGEVTVIAPALITLRSRQRWIYMLWICIKVGNVSLSKICRVDAVLYNSCGLKLRPDAVNVIELGSEIRKHTA